LFRRVRETGVVPITDERMTRFWITLPQAVAFVARMLETMRGGEVFVPKIPSMKLVDLAEAIAPECTRKVIGIRPGEKIHELLITVDEARHTLDAGDFYVIEPEHGFWSREKFEGTPMPPDGVYRSDTNEEWLSVEQLRELLGDE
jgi:UDP-N-acetylglucosamine 4,6-dehydratase